MVSWLSPPSALSNHVLTEDIVFREVTPNNCLISRRLLTKTSRSPRWMERYLPKHMASSAYIIEDSIVDPQERTMTTLTWNISHARLMVPACFHPPALGSKLKMCSHAAFVLCSQSVEEHCRYQINPENSCWTEITREARISSGVCGLSRAIQVSEKERRAKHLRGNGFQNKRSTQPSVVLWCLELRVLRWSPSPAVNVRRSDLRVVTTLFSGIWSGEVQNKRHKDHERLWVRARQNARWVIVPVQAGGKEKVVKLYWNDLLDISVVA